MLTQIGAEDRNDASQAACSKGGATSTVRARDRAEAGEAAPVLPRVAILRDARAPAAGATFVSGEARLSRRHPFTAGRRHR